MRRRAKSTTAKSSLISNSQNSGSDSSHRKESARGQENMPPSSGMINSFGFNHEGSIDPDDKGVDVEAYQSGGGG